MDGYETRENELEPVSPPSREIDRVRSAVRREMPMLVALSAATNILMLTTSVYMLQLIDRVLTSGSLDTLIFLSAIAVAAIAAYAGLEHNRKQILTRLGVFIQNTLGPAVTDSLIRRGAADDAMSAPVSHANVRDVNAFLSGGHIVAFLDAPWSPIFVAFIALIHPALALLTIAGGVLMLSLAYVNDRFIHRMARRDMAEAVRESVRSKELVDHAEAVLALGMRETVVRRMADAAWRRADALLTTTDWQSALGAISRMLRLVLQIAILGMGAYFVLANQMTSGGMIAASIMMGRALAPVERAIPAWQSLINARRSWRALLDELSGVVKTTSVRLPRPTGRLIVQDLAVAAPRTTEPLLTGVNLVAEPSQLLVIAGASGSGKSTMARVLIGLREPLRGAIMLDDTDLTRWPDQDLGRYIGYLPQEIDLLDGSIAENIARFGAAQPAKVLEASRLAGAHQFISALPDGYETQIGIGGRQLSGGQRQRIGFARALYGAPPLIVLDEPSAFLDPDGEEVMIRALKSAMKDGCTVIVTTHHRRLAEEASRVIMLRDGHAQHFVFEDNRMKPISADRKVVSLRGDVRRSLTDSIR